MTSAVAMGGAAGKAPALPCLVVGEGAFAPIVTEEVGAAGGECVGIVSPSVSRSDAKNGGPRRFRTISEGIRETFAAIVVIATPNNTHVELVLESLRAGAHALLAAPSGCTTEDWRRVVSSAKAMRRQVQLTAESRLFPEFKDLSWRIRSGEFGRLEKARFFVSAGLPSRGWHRNGQKSHGLLSRYGESMLDHLTQCTESSAPFQWVRSSGDRVSYCGPGSVPVRQFVKWECDRFRAEWEGQIDATESSPVAEIVYECSEGTVVLDWTAGWAAQFKNGQRELDRAIPVSCAQRRVARLAYEDLCQAIHDKRECLASLANMGWAVSAVHSGMEAFHTGKKLPGSNPAA